MKGRFAPSPTGRLHLGNARSALLGWLHARAQGGQFLLRIEDLDSARCRPEFEQLIYRDLEFLGLTWDGPVWRQSERDEVYRATLDRLREAGWVFDCSCSRADLARAASAPHAGEEGPRYPGTCRQGPTRTDRPTCVRFRVDAREVRFVDLVHGPYTQDVSEVVGDFVVRRADGVASYQLAVVVDDAASGITHVLRADDLLSSTPRQVLLYRAIEAPEPRFAHVPLLLAEGGARLAKREGSFTVSGLRQAGVSAERLVGQLAAWSGLGDGRPVRAAELVEQFSLDRVSREPATVTAAALEALVAST